MLKKQKQTNSLDDAKSGRREREKEGRMGRKRRGKENRRAVSRRRERNNGERERYEVEIG